MATVRTSGTPEGAWQVRWSEWPNTVDPDGTERRVRVQRARQFATKAEADKFRREVADDLAR